MVSSGIRVRPNLLTSCVPVHSQSQRVNSNPQVFLYLVQADATRALAAQFMPPLQLQPGKKMGHEAGDFNAVKKFLQIHFSHSPCSLADLSGSQTTMASTIKLILIKLPNLPQRN